MLDQIPPVCYFVEIFLFHLHIIANGFKWQKLPQSDHFAMKPDLKARKEIDHLLSLAGRTVPYRTEVNLGGSHGAAVR
jgi:hypothetical protein